MTAQLNDYEYDYLTNQWEGPHGAAYNAVAEFCVEFGWCHADTGGLTELGKEAVVCYEKERGIKKRIDVC